MCIKFEVLTQNYIEPIRAGNQKKGPGMGTDLLSLPGNPMVSSFPSKLSLSTVCDIHPSQSYELKSAGSGDKCPMQEDHQRCRQSQGNDSLHKPQGAGHIRGIRFLSIFQEHIVSGLLQADAQGAGTGGHGPAGVGAGRRAMIL